MSIRNRFQSMVTQCYKGWRKQARLYSRPVRFQPIRFQPVTSATLLTCTKSYLPQQRIRPVMLNAVLPNNQCSMDLVTYEEIANASLDLLSEFFESLSDDGSFGDDFDVQLSSGVLTVSVGGDFGTYVINKQTPNRQLWLSSPTSGPKRYDFMDGRWIYSHTGEDMNDLLSKEFSEILNREVDFSKLKYTIET